jgi:hypothetical protein
VGQGERTGIGHRSGVIAGGILAVGWVVYPSPWKFYVCMHRERTGWKGKARAKGNS